MIFETIGNNLELFALLASFILTIIMMFFILKLKKKKQIITVFLVLHGLIILWEGGLLLQLLFSELSGIPPILFDYFVYIGICLTPVAIYFLGEIFTNTKIVFKKRHLLFLVVPVLSLLMLWTNDFHHLFYEEYDTIRTGVIYGPYFKIHTIYSYLLIAIGLFKMITHSVRSVGLFSKQSLLIFTGILIPVIVNVLFTLQILDLSVYATPISFALGLFFFALGIIRFKFLNANSIALKFVVDRISDAYLVISDDFEVLDYNDTFMKIFNKKNVQIRSQNVFELKDLQGVSEFVNKNYLLKKTIQDVMNNNKVVSFEKNFKRIDKIFEIELTAIKNDSNNTLLGVLILFKDITQHKKDIQKIKDNQEVLMESDRLASLGQLIGGIAHNLKTPIMSISGNLQGLQDLITEYNVSIGDPDVNNEDHKAIAQDMQDLVDKTKIHLSYMSDIITVVKGQAVHSTEAQIFSPMDVLNRIDILMKHNLKKALVNLQINIEEGAKTAYIKGDINGLIQVIDNIIQNAIYAYNGNPNEKIDLTITKEENMIQFKIQDYGTGISDQVKDKLFKEMITTRGKNGTGLGLYMSYSMIKGNFKGDMYFESEEGKGTTFYIKVPISE